MAKSPNLDSVPLEDLQAALQKRQELAEAQKVQAEEARVSELKARHEDLSRAHQVSTTALADFIAALSEADLGILGIKVPAHRCAKGATEAALRAHLQTLAPGSRFTVAGLLEEVVPDASAATVRASLAAIGLTPIGKGKATHYIIQDGPNGKSADQPSESAAEVPAAGESASETAGAESAY